MTSNIISSLLDSVVFLSIAFGVTAALHGALAMTIGKLLASLIALGALIAVGWGLRRRRAELPSVPQHDATQAGTERPLPLQ